MLISTCLGYANDLISFAAFPVINTESSEINLFFLSLYYVFVLEYINQRVNCFLNRLESVRKTDDSCSTFVCLYENLVLPDLFHVKRSYMVNPLA